MISLEQCSKTLKNPESDTWTKYSALFALRTIGTDKAAKLLEANYSNLGTSELLKHETMYVMGQMQALNSLNFLIQRMHDEKEFPIVRHEAGEALANFHHIKDQCVAEMLKHWDSDISILKSTVRVGIEKLKNYTPQSRYGKKYGGTIEPAEPFNLEELSVYLDTDKQGEELILQIKSKLLKSNSEVDEYSKYRMCYYLRDENTLTSKKLLCELLSPKNREFISPLLRHEISFILGQVYNHEPELKETLKRVSLDDTEISVVRHEAILAYYDIEQDKALIDYLKKHKDQLVRESAECAVHMNE